MVNNWPSAADALLELCYTKPIHQGLEHSKGPSVVLNPNKMRFASSQEFFFNPFKAPLCNQATDT